MTPRERVEALAVLQEAATATPWWVNNSHTAVPDTQLLWLLRVAKAAVAYSRHHHRFVHGVCENCADDALIAAVEDKP